mmetsp:Transcript_26680/g.37819  ORF Transcript_26680/g.37819 Transcript_26680/m.37819 type:complete len:84 (+) Transcript_26680:51-302(+)
MLGVPINGKCAVFCDNGSVVTNIKPESMLKKKHTAINFHQVQETIAAGTIKVSKEHRLTNLADILTKPLARPRLRELVQYILR